MTFYNIIFAILFLGACQQAVASVGTDHDSLSLVLVAVLVFTDAINTAETIETRGFEYNIYMKLFDLASFLALGATLILLSKGGTNLLGVSIGWDKLPELIRNPVVPPLLLLFYCFMVFLWILFCPELKNPKEWPWKLLVSALVLVAMLVAAAIFRGNDPQSFPYQVVVVVAIIAALIYMIYYVLIPLEPHQKDAAKIADELRRLATQVQGAANSQA